MRPQETDVGAAVVRWFTDQRFDVYQEVQQPQGAIADVVARAPVGRRLAVAECKTTFSQTVIGQALHGQPFAHWAYIATPRPRGGAGVARLICDALGLGLLVYDPYERSIRELVRPRLNRHPSTWWADCLCEGHKTHAPAGSQAGTRYTPFRSTVEALEAFVATHPACSLKDAVDGIAHHYATPATARSCIAQWVRKGIITTVAWQETPGQRRRTLHLARPTASTPRKEIPR
jgi:hypothetical protein